MIDWLDGYGMVIEIEYFVWYLVYGLGYYVDDNVIYRDNE